MIFARTADGELVNLAHVVTAGLVHVELESGATVWQTVLGLVYEDNFVLHQGTEQECRRVLAALGRACNLHPSLDLTQGVPTP